jgi:putative ABC transport system permease protein
MLIDNIKMAFKNIKERKSRVFLTLIGIAIGIMAIVALRGMGQGMEEAVKGELSSLSDTIIVTTGSINVNGMGGGGSFTGSQGVYFTDRDIETVERIQGLKSVDPVLFGAGAIKYNGIIQGVSFIGMDAQRMSDIFGIGFLGLSEGEFLTNGDQNKAIIGYNIAHDSFDTDIPIGGKIEINGNNFVVNGIYNKQGAGMSIPTDDNIYLNVRDFKKLTGDKNVSGILIRVYDVEQAEDIANEIKESINQNHGTDDFANVITMASIIESIQSVLWIIQMVLLGIAAIALVVASIGIMNTMLTSVMERTHEIGIMKAIGARNFDVMSIFITEGITISLIGGIVGVMLGIVGSRVFTSAIGFSGDSGMSLSPVITIENIALAMFVAILVGVMSSLYPARKAAKMSPIEAVRYE